MHCLSTEEIIERAQKKIILLDSQKKTVQNIAALLSLHLKRLNALEEGVDTDFLPCFSELIIAPTGSGKTYLISKLAEAAGLPFYSIDCSMLTLSGYKGVNLSEAFRSLKANCTRPGEFHRSVILFDEFDKCSFRSGENGNVQPNFLKLLEGEGLSCDEKIIDTSEMLFLFAGAFQGLDKLAEQRCQKKSIGFAAESEEKKKPALSMEDVQTYGFSRELLGRIGSLHCIPRMEIEDYMRLLLDGKASIAEKFGSLFAAQGVRFFVDEKACLHLSEQAMERKMGARAMEAVVKEKVLQAVKEIDSNTSIVEAVLTMKDGEAVFRYTYGEREFSSLVEVDAPDLEPPMTVYLRTEKGINDLCAKWSDFAEEGSEEICYYFLQVILRYLVLETNWSDRTLHSVESLAEQTKCQNVEGKKTTFDVLMEDLIPKSENSTHHSVLLHYYYLYKTLEDTDTKTILCHMVKQIKEKSNIR